MAEQRQYELVYVVSPDLGEDGISALHTQVDEIVTGLGGRIEKTDNWGQRRLAYEIGKHREGTYVVALINGPGSVVSELDRKLKVLDTVLRHLIVRVDEDLRKAERARQKRKVNRKVGQVENEEINSVSTVESSASEQSLNSTPNVAEDVQSVTEKEVSQ